MVSRNETLISLLMELKQTAMVTHVGWHALLSEVDSSIETRLFQKKKSTLAYVVCAKTDVIDRAMSLS